jgi:hypothetical protein
MWERLCMEKTWPPSQVAWPAGLSSGPHVSNLWPQHHLTLPINTMVLPSSFLYSRVRGKGLRAGGLPGLSGVLRVARAQKLCHNLFGLDGVFRAPVWSSAEAMPEFSEFQQGADSRVPLVY